ncbi:uncharacterized protein LOC127850651 [Dreissena polymorpha]|uniref:Uncharacterized protein n=1 Tax=Dreissena polymorpha TaxID=45954 RepID=A0A9D4HVV9_DREPO|nr:uncharacterized protein LOC127850651 [Dreissena polymorpha]KAH3734754.1 hypothetical protein DPMN_041200 [Dreissena polymorpha]
MPLLEGFVILDAVSAGIGSCPVNSINGAFVIEKSTPPDAVSAGIGSRPVSSINGTLNKDALPEMSVEELDNPALKPVHRTNLAPLPNLPNLNTNRIRPMIPPINNHV